MAPLIFEPARLGNARRACRRPRCRCQGRSRTRTSAATASSWPCRQTSRSTRAYSSARWGRPRPPPRARHRSPTSPVPCGAPPGRPPTATAPADRKLLSCCMHPPSSRGSDWCADTVRIPQPGPRCRRGAPCSIAQGPHRTPRTSGCSVQEISGCPPGLRAVLAWSSSPGTDSACSSAHRTGDPRCVDQCVDH